MPDIGRLAEIWRYPVSSLAGEALAEAAIDTAGVRGDRSWGAVDAISGEIARPGKQPRWDATPQVAARLAGAGVEIRVVRGDEADGPWLEGAGARRSQQAQKHHHGPIQAQQIGVRQAADPSTQPGSPHRRDLVRHHPARVT